MISEGQTAPDFELLGTDGDEIREYRLDDYLEDGPVVLTFYLFDFHPECTDALCSVRDAEWLDLVDGVQVFGVGTDSAFSHRAFATEMDVRFPLLSDGDGAVSDAYGVLWDEFRGHRNVSQRAAFVVDEAQTVRYAWQSEDPSERPDFTAVAEVAREVADATVDST